MWLISKAPWQLTEAPRVIAFGAQTSVIFSPARERIFYEKVGVLGTKIWEICILRAEILSKNKAENTVFKNTLLYHGEVFESEKFYFVKRVIKD